MESHLGTTGKEGTQKVRSRPSALLTKPQKGKSYDEALRAIRKGARQEELAAKFQMVRKTRASDILLEWIIISRTRRALLKQENYWGRKLAWMPYNPKQHWSFGTQTAWPLRRRFCKQL
ncbi:hypothetical protein Trydic_g7923 [Trypoxylus dichotomus]